LLIKIDTVAQLKKEIERFSEERSSVKTCAAFQFDFERDYCYRMSNPGLDSKNTVYDNYFGNYFLYNNEVKRLRKLFRIVQRIATTEWRHNYFLNKTVELPHPFGFALGQFVKIYEEVNVERIPVAIWNAFENLCLNSTFRWRGKYLPYNASNDYNC
jgi:hypothetical protein